MISLTHAMCMGFGFRSKERSVRAKTPNGVATLFRLLVHIWPNMGGYSGYPSKFPIAIVLAIFTD